MNRPLRGLWTATVTPVDGIYRCDVGRLQAHCRRLIEQGCDGVALFGTTGEGPAFAAAERMHALEALLAGGFPPERLIVSASAAALPDSVELARQATKAGVAGVLLMPPFLFREGIGDEGVFRFYAALIDKIGDPALSALLYHIPGASGVAVRPPVVRRLMERYPRNITGIKRQRRRLELHRGAAAPVFLAGHFHRHRNPYSSCPAAGWRRHDLRARQRDRAAASPALRRSQYHRAQSLPPAIQRADSIMSRGAFIACLKA